MPAEARVSEIWKKQKLFLSIFCIAVAGWFFFDGAVTWPRENVRWTAHDTLVKEGKSNEWPALARSHAWNVRPPEKFHATEDLAMQYIFGGLFACIGVLLLIYWFTQRTRTLRTDEEAVYTAAGTRVPFHAITAINKAKWDSKGIAKVRYALEGRHGEFLVDDYKFDTMPTRQILEEIEERMPNRGKTESTEAAA